MKIINIMYRNSITLQKSDFFHFDLFSFGNIDGQYWIVFCGFLFTLNYEPIGD